MVRFGPPYNISINRLSGSIKGRIFPQNLHFKKFIHILKHIATKMKFTQNLHKFIFFFLFFSFFFNPETKIIKAMNSIRETVHTTILTSDLFGLSSLHGPLYSII